MERVAVYRKAANGNWEGAKHGTSCNGSSNK